VVVASVAGGVACVASCGVAVESAVGGVVWAGVASCATAAVPSASADAKRIIFISFLQPFVVGE
jgi:hypothetical protein